jgi:chromatin remodeling complex protein RSC6
MTTKKSGTPGKAKVKRGGPVHQQPGQRPAKPIDYSPLQPMRPSKALAALVGPERVLFSEASGKVWAYVRRRGLLDRRDNSMINADAALKAILGKARASRVELTQAVKGELTP